MASSSLLGLARASTTVDNSATSPYAQRTMTQQPRTIETLTQLADVTKQIDRLQAERDRLVGAARSEHQSWRAIADALGVSHQAAWKAHRNAAATVEAVRGRSDLAEAQAMALAKDVQREVRSETIR